MRPFDLGATDGLLYQQPAPPAGGLLGPAYVNPLMARQVANARAANPRPDVTDIFGYGPDWTSYGGALRQNLAAQMPTPGATDRANIEKTLGLLSFAPFGMTVFHGSPHRFDKFDMSKIGTGEGAQAYGHGLYFAENPKVAGGYASSLGKYEVNGGQMDWANPAHVAALEVHLKGGDFAKAADSLYRAAKQRVHSAKPSVAMDASKILDGILENKAISKADRASQIPAVKQGNLYKVDLPDDQIAKMLDWDKPLSQQPESVRKALDAAGINANGALYGLGDVKGSQLMHVLAQGHGPAKASERLRHIGIPGIRYLDGGSRAGGKGTSNFVVFDDSIPKIIGRE